MPHINLSDAFPPYLSFLFNIHLSLQPVTILVIMFILGILITGLLLYLKYLDIKKSLREPYTFLEVKPTDRTLKSPLSTHQLFTVLHSLGKESSGWFIKTKRSISEVY
jgi:hypothetical protein